MPSSQAIIVGGGIAALPAFNASDEAVGRGVFITADIPAAVGPANFGEIPTGADAGANWVIGQLFDLNATQAASPTAVVLGRSIANIATWGPTLGSNSPVIIGNLAGANVTGGTVIQSGIAIGRAAITDGNAVVIGAGCTVNCNAGSDTPVIIQSSGTTANGVSSLVAIGCGALLVAWRSGLAINAQGDVLSGEGSTAIAARVEAGASIAIGGGGNAATNGSTTIAIGPNSRAGGPLFGTAYSNCIAIGSSALATGTGATGDRNAIAIGISATATVTASTASAIALGRSASAGDNQCVIGSASFPVDCFLAGPVTGAPNKILQGNSNASGTDIANGEFRIQPGASTGNAAGGSIVLRTGATGASGTTVQTQTARLTITGGTGLVAVAAPTSGHALQVTGLTPNEAVRVVAGAGTDPSIRFNGYTDGSGASAGTLANAPSAGDPAFWLRINIAGTDHFIPCWT